VTANVSWNASTTDSFLTITSGASGSGNGTINVSAQANPGSQRTGHVAVAGSGVSATLTVNQAAASTPPPSNISFSPASQTLSADSQTGTTTLTSNVSWTATRTSADPFLTIAAGSTSGGAGSPVFTYTVTANGGTTQRMATVVASGTGGSGTLTVTQNGLTPSLTFSATAPAVGGNCRVDPAPGGSPLPAQILCKFDASGSQPLSLITSFDYRLVELSNEQLLAPGQPVAGSTLTGPLTACGFPSGSATPVTIRLTIKTASGQITKDLSVSLVKNGVC
jgi:hypothetical protein